MASKMQTAASALDRGPYGESVGILADRRAFHGFVLDVLLPDEPLPASLEPEIADDVHLRIALSRAIDAHEDGVDKTEAVRDRLRMLADGPRRPLAMFPPLWLADDGDASTPEALRTILDEATRNDLTGIRAEGELVDVTDELRTRYARACALLMKLDGDLAASIIPHASACLWVNVGTDDAVMESGSARTMPGVVLLSEQYVGNDFQAARALLHEAAHSKLFDLYLTRAILPFESNLLVDNRVRCPWNPDTELQSNRWPVDQALAAAHVYVHLTRIDAAVPVSERPTYSPDSAGRAEYLLDALQALPDECLGADGWKLVSWLQECLGS